MSKELGEEFIEHYGVKGMKWGIRRSPEQLARAAGRRETRATNRQIKSERKQVAKSRRTLSDSDLNNYVDRLQKEKKLRSLVAEDTSPGRTFTQSILSNTGRTVIGAIATGTAMYAVRAKMQGNWDWKEASAYLKPKK